MWTPLLLLTASTAMAGPFSQKTMMGPWPERQVARDFVLPKGWFELGLRVDSKLATQERDKLGVLQPFDHGTRWRYSRLWVDVHQGFSPRVTLYARIPVVSSRLVNDFGTDVRTVALGDVHTGLIWQPWSSDGFGAGFSMDLKSPSGVEWPGDFIGGPANTRSFLTGTGITNLGFFGHLRGTFGDVGALRGTVGWVHKFAGIVGYVVEEDGFGNGWLKPGDELRVDVEGLVNLGDDVALGVGSTLSRRGMYQIGTSGESVWRAALTEIPDSSGTFVDVTGRASWEPSAHVELGFWAGAQVSGAWTGLFDHLGLDEFSPLPGLTLGGEGVVRW